MYLSQEGTVVGRFRVNVTGLHEASGGVSTKGQKAPTAGRALEDPGAGSSDGQVNVPVLAAVTGINKKPELGGDHKTTERDVVDSEKNQSASGGERHSD